PALTWLEQQRNDETGLVYQHLELGTDIDERWLNYCAPTVDRAREAAALAGVDVPPSLEEQIREAMELRHPERLPVVELLPSPAQLTLVSVLIYLEQSSVDPAGRLTLLQPLFASGIPLVLYLDWYYTERLDPALVPPWVTLRTLELHQTEAWNAVANADRPLGLPAIRTESKDTIEYMALQNAKTEVVWRAVRDGLVTTPFAGFIDSGVAKLFSDRSAAFARLAAADLSGLDRVLIPGCWEMRPRTVEELADKVSWVFCGSMFILPAALAERFDRLARKALDEFLAKGRLAWEVNVWSLLAGNHPDLFHWYLSDHNDRLTDHPARYAPPREDPPTSSMPQTWQEVLDAPAFVINLDRSPERLGPVMERIAAAGFTDIRRVRAVDGFVPEELADAWSALGNPRLAVGDHSFRHRAGHQGCFLTHVHVWQRMLDEGIESATIFEDDVVFHPEWHRIAPDRWNATRFGTHVVWFGAAPAPRAAYDPDAAVVAVPVFGTWSYWLDRRGAEQ
ncbi:MAG: glycosyltransferase family 25 protein, partial [Thermomicrobiales bacterium]